MHWPKITVVTLSYNQAAFLETALCSVLDQDYPAVEYIVVDPGSSDGSRDIISRYDSRIDRTILEPDDGPADGLNRALAQASGEIFAYINSDDAFLPGAFRQAATVFADRPHCDVVYGNGFFIDAKGEIGRRFLSDKFSAKRSVHGCGVVMQQSTFLRRTAVEGVGGFVVDNRTCWDGELLLDIALNGGRFFRSWQDWGILGHGSWAKDPELTYHYAVFEHRRRIGYDAYGYIATDLLPTHSHLFGAWVESGIVGGVFWIWVLTLVARALVVLYRSDERLTPILVIIAFLLLWDIPFSPFGAERRFTTTFFVIAMMWTIDRAGTALRQGKSNA